MSVRAHHWGWAVFSGLAVFGILEIPALTDRTPDNTATGRVRKWRNLSRLNRAALAFGLGGSALLAVDHFLYDDGRAGLTESA